MKVLRQLCAITVLTLVFAQFAAAEEGVIHPGITLPPPPPPPTNAIAQPGLDETGKLIDTDGADDLMTDLTLSIVQSLLALF